MDKILELEIELEENNLFSIDQNINIITCNLSP